MAITYPSMTGSTSPAYKTNIPYAVDMRETAIKRTWNQTTSSTTVLIATPWTPDDYFAQEMLGYSQRSGTTLFRVLPERCPLNEKQYALSCDLVQQTGFNAAAVSLYEGWPEFSLNDEGIAIYQVVYAAPLYNVLEDEEVSVEHERFCVYTPRGVAENEKMPGAGFFTINAAKTPIAEVGIKTGRVVELEIKWIDVPYVNYTKIASLSNKINENDWVVGIYTFAAESVLFKTWAAQPRVTPIGDLTNDITLTFSVRQDGRTWNKFWVKPTVANPDGLIEVSSDGTVSGQRPYEVADLDGIFSFA